GPVHRLVARRAHYDRSRDVAAQLAGHAALAGAAQATRPAVRARTRRCAALALVAVGVRPWTLRATHATVVDVLVGVHATGAAAREVAHAAAHPAAGAARARGAAGSAGAPIPRATGATCALDAAAAAAQGHRRKAYRGEVSHEAERIRLSA